MHDISNVVIDVRSLSAFIVQGDRTKRQWFDDGSDVDLWAASCTNVKFMQAKFDEFLHELEDFVTRRRKPGRVRAFVERIQDNENWALRQKSQHLFQTFL